LQVAHAPFSRSVIAPFSLRTLAEAVCETMELHRIVSDAIGELPDDQRQAVTLRYLRGLTLAEIAILTSAPVGTLKARLHHSRARLKESLIASLSITPKHTPEQGWR